MNFFASIDIPLRTSGNSLVARCLPLLSALWLAGCATEPHFVPTMDQASQPVSDDRPTYNKSYVVRGRSYVPMRSARGYRQTGLASWYGEESGNATATGARFKPGGLTAAHKTLPLPCKVRVTNLRNGRSVDVVVNDRGPFRDDRLIDLSRAAASRLGIDGVGQVEIEYLGS